ncbi:MAG: hypothetical protein PHX65_04020 [Sulfurimonas sp.]|nr:hypothetical protein [Sulfurimonas sp.]
MEKARQILIRQLRETLDFIEHNDNLDEIEMFLKYYRRPYYDRDIRHRLDKIESQLNELNNKPFAQCLLSKGKNEENLSYLITGMTDKFHEEKKNIFSWLSGSKKLIICDPYFYSFDKPKKHFKTHSNYIEFLKELIPNGLNELDIFHFEGPNRTILKSFSDYCKKKNIKLRNYPTGAIHDRVIIKDNDRAKMLGTSFGGLGNKIAFFVDLPEEDVNIFKEELHKIRKDT